jgi:membrane-associated protease RseP (regulator of RpoE activity)
MSVDGIYMRREAMKPTLRTWIKHTILFVITLITATIAGSLIPFGNLPILLPDPQNWGEFFNLIANFPAYYAVVIATPIYFFLSDPQFLLNGLSFSLSLLFILLSHEMGHYVMCRIYGVDATLPYFIPTPPMIGPAGTFGAFIKIMSPMPSRKAVFDIGVAGPIAGFIALIPIAIIGVATMQPVPAGMLEASGGLTFSDPLLMQLIGLIVGKDPGQSIGNPFYFAAWVGLLVTALNLIPSGQLDGGHAVYAVLGKRAHFFTGRIALIAMTVLSITGFLFFNSPSGFLFVILLAIVTRIGHPDPLDQAPLDTKRRLIALFTLLVFVLCFVPFPIKVSLS